jgi:hypothetical protein
MAASLIEAPCILLALELRSETQNWRAGARKPSLAHFIRQVMLANVYVCNPKYATLNEIVYMPHTCTSVLLSYL